jgi:hypothetical protein
MSWAVVKNRIAADPARYMADVGDKFKQSFQLLTDSTWLGGRKKTTLADDSHWATIDEDHGTTSTRLSGQMAFWRRSTTTQRQSTTFPAIARAREVTFTRSRRHSNAHRAADAMASAPRAPGQSPHG